jgi:hypothetical protein
MYFFNNVVSHFLATEQLLVCSSFDGENCIALAYISFSLKMIGGLA